MQAIHADNVTWKSQERGVREAKIFSTHHGSEETRIDLVEVPSGGYIPAHRHSSRREFITILLSAGAQLQIGDRIFRPVAGQVFHREPGDVMALTNDSHHPFRYSVVRFGYESSDVEILQEVEDGDDLVSGPPEAIDEKVESTVESGVIAKDEEATTVVEVEEEASEAEEAGGAEQAADDVEASEDEESSKSSKGRKKSK